MQATKNPEVLTVNGKAAVVMVDPESYDKLELITHFFTMPYS